MHRSLASWRSILCWNQISSLSGIVVVSLCGALIACEDSTAKFHPGDIVVDKLNRRVEGVVYLRLRPSVHQIYYLKLQRNPKEISEGASETYVDGPYDEDQLELVRRR